MVGRNYMGRQWVERMELEPAVWTTELSEEHANLAKRQLGFEFTLGGAVLSVGLDSNGLPAFTVTAVPAPNTPAPAPTPAQDVPVVNEPVPAPTAAAPVPQDTSTGTPAVVPPSSDNTLPAAPGSASDTVLPPPTSAPLDPAASTDLPPSLVNTETGNSILPTALILTPGASSLATSRSSSSITSRPTGLQTTTQVIIRGGSAVTNVMTITPEATPESSSLSPPAIAGAVVGAVGGTAALLLLLVLCVRWRRHMKDNKRKSAAGESVKALHTGAAPMMAHNSARYTNMFPNGGGVVISDADSAKVAFLPAGGAAFLNRASNSPLHSPARADSPLSHDGEGQAGIQDRMLSIPPSPSVPDRYKSGNSAEVAFLAADASTWLNRQSNQPIPQSGPGSGLAPGAAAAVAAHNSSTPSLPSQTAPPPENGTVAFLPGTASAFLNRNTQSPLGSDGPPTEQGTAPTNDSNRSLPSHVAPAPAGGQVAFLPGDASAFLNRNTNSPLQSVGSTNEQPFPPAAPSSSAPSSIPYSTEAPENGQVTFLPADASGFLNRNSAGPLGVPQVSTPPPVPSVYNAGAAAAAAAAAAGLAVPAAAHAADRDSAGTTTNHKLNDNPEWFGSDYHDSRHVPAAAVAEAARRSQPPGSMQHQRGQSGSEIDDFLAGSSYPPQDSYGPVQSQNPFEAPRFGSPVETSPERLTDQNIAQQDFSGANMQSGPARTPDVRHTPPPINIPSGTHNSAWKPPQAGQAAPGWPGSEDESWYQPSSPELGASSSSLVTTWPKPPEVNWDRPRIRPRGI